MIIVTTRVNTEHAEQRTYRYRIETFGRNLLVLDVVGEHWGACAHTRLKLRQSGKLLSYLKIPYYTVFHQFYTAVRGPTTLYSI